jgi:hypothetical protein
MTDIASKEKLPDDEVAGATETGAPAPEPWTARRVLEWNSYYDLYVAAFVVLLAFLGTANKIPAMNSGIWSLLQAGRQIAETRAPVVTDTTSIAGEGLRWVNVPWLYELSHYAIYQGGAALGPKPEPGAPVSRFSGPREQYGAGALIAVDALVRAFTAFLLLGLRRKGPGLWWTALCAAMAVGVTLGPATIESVSSTSAGEVIRSVRPWLGVQIGGIASPASVVGPETWGLMLLALELLLLHQAMNLGKTGRLYALVPVFLLWANMDDSFGFGLLVLAASVIGMNLASRRDPSRGLGRSGWIALGLCFAATFVSPSHVFGVHAGFDLILKSIGSIPRAIGLNFGPPSARSQFLFSPVFGPVGFDGIARTLRFYYLALLALGLASFLLNRRDFSLGRFLAFLVASLLWALNFGVFTSPFAVVLAASLALNGQEWYHRTYGLEGRLGAGWTVWSTGGRLITLAVIFAAIARGVTGWGGQVGDAQFGFGFNPDDFPFESAEAIRDAPIEGGILNTSLPQGDAIAWKSGSGLELGLLPSVEDVSRIPTSMKKLVIVARLNDALHFRIFDGDGNMVADKGEASLAAQAGPISELKIQLERLWPPHQPTDSERGQVIAKVASIVGYTLPSKRRAYVDSRAHLYPPSVFDDLRELRNDIKNDDIAKWQPALDRLKISAVMIQLIGSPQDVAPNTYTKLLGSPNWMPFYDDGAIVIFGRVDAKAPAADVAYFKANRLDAAERVYKRPRLVPPWERPPTVTSEFDRIFQNRLLNRPQPHNSAALHWLEPANLPPGKPYLPDPARCIMAIQEARAALSLKPDDSTAFQILIDAYQRLLAQESALIAGIALTPENITKITQAPSQARILVNRNRQLLTALNFRLQTLPPSKSQDDQRLKASLNLNLAQIYLQSNALDLAKQRLSLVADEAQTSGMNDELLRNVTNQLQELYKRIDQIQTQMSDLGINQRASPLDKAGFARANGAPGLAIHELEEVNDAGGNVPGVRPMLVDLYCEAGLPDKALDVIVNLNPDDPTLASIGTNSVGTASYRQGMVYFLLGNYSNAAGLWQDRSIAPLRSRRDQDGLTAGQMLLTGNPINSVRTLLDLPEKVSTQARWEYELGLAALEGGLPTDLVADHLQSALKLEPNLAVRPVIAYYLEMLGKTVPPPRPNPSDAKPATPSATPTTPSATPTTPSDKPDLPANLFSADPPKP